MLDSDEEGGTTRPRRGPKTSSGKLASERQQDLMARGWTVLCKSACELSELILCCVHWCVVPGMV